MVPNLFLVPNLFYLLFYFNIFMDKDKSQSLSFIVGSSKITLTPTIKSKRGTLGCNDQNSSRISVQNVT